MTRLILNVLGAGGRRGLDDDIGMHARTKYAVPRRKPAQVQHADRFGAVGSTHTAHREVPSIEATLVLRRELLVRNLDRGAVELPAVLSVPSVAVHIGAQVKELAGPVGYPAVKPEELEA